MFVGFEFKNLELAVGIDRLSERLNDETDSLCLSSLIKKQTSRFLS